MGNGRKNVATSSDCGKAWSVGSTMDDYGGNHVIGMYFVSDKIAFMRFDPNNSHTIPDGPEISQTLDGGKTWQRLAVSVPDSLKGKKLIAGAPTHMGDVIIFPVWHNPAHGSIEGDAVYLVSRDNGITWAWEDDLERSYPSFEEILDAVLENRMPVTFASSGNTRSLSEFSSVMGLSVTKYSVLDLDGDSRSEAVLWISRGADEYYGFLVLHCDGDTVYAHEFTYRGFNGLKADGTYHASSSAFNSSVRKLAFDGGTCSVIILAHRDGDKTSEPVVYTVNGRIASADEFDAFFAEYENKPDAVWYDYIAE